MAKLLSFAALFIAVSVFLSGVWLRRTALTGYRAVASNLEIGDAFSHGNAARIRQVAQRYHLQYQKFSGTTLEYASARDLPAVTIVPVQLTPAPGVLEIPLDAALVQLQPNIKIMRDALYVIFPIVSSARPLESYVVYAPVR